MYENLIKLMLLLLVMMIIKLIPLTKFSQNYNLPIFKHRNRMKILNNDHHRFYIVSTTVYMVHLSFRYWCPLYEWKMQTFSGLAQDCEGLNICKCNILLTINFHFLGISFTFICRLLYLFFMPNNIMIFQWQ